MSINIKIFHDFIWPFCYIGKGIVEKLEKEYDLDVEWLGMEIHPETPEGGVSLEETFGKLNLEEMFSGLNKLGLPYGISFDKLENMPNSRNALAAAEFAKTHGKFKEYHCALIDAYFRDLKDIGDLEVLSGLGESVGLNKKELISAVKNNVYGAILDNNAKQALQMGIDTTPTFVINDKYTVVGSQPIEEYRKILGSI